MCSMPMLWTLLSRLIIYFDRSSNRGLLLFSRFLNYNIYSPDIEYPVFQHTARISEFFVLKQTVFAFHANHLLKGPDSIFKKRNSSLSWTGVSTPTMRAYCFTHLNEDHSSSPRIISEFLLCKALLACALELNPRRNFSQNVFFFFLLAFALL